LSSENRDTSDPEKKADIINERSIKNTPKYESNSN